MLVALLVLLMAIPVSTRPSDVPPPLWQAMVQAGSRYNVPPLILAATWRGESASTYPNPAVNSEGYGGLFGTKDWDGSTQAQADLAASVWHNALVRTRGNILEANGIYATGQPTPGLYGHAGLPTGVVPGYGGRGRLVAAPPVSSSSSGGGGGGGGGVGGFFAGVGHDIASPFETAYDDTVGVFSSTVDFFNAIAWLISPKTWLRITEAGFGFVLILVSVLVAAGADKQLEQAGVAGMIPVE